MTETATRAAGEGMRCLTVVVGPRRYDVVVDEHLLVAEVLALVCPDRDLVAVTMSGETVPLDESVAVARLDTGTMLLTTPAEAAVPSPRVRPAGSESTSAPGAPSIASEAHTAGSRSTLQSRRASTVVPPGAGSSRRRLGHARHTGSSASAPTTPTPPTMPRTASPGRRGSRRPAASRRLRRRGRPAASARPAALALVAALFAGVAVVAFFRAPPTVEWWPQVVAAVLLAAGLLLVQGGSAAHLLRLVTPVLGLAGGAVVAGGFARSPLVALVGGCAGAALVALAGRPGAGPDRHVPRVWLAFCGGLGALSVLVLLMGMPLEVVAAVALGAVTLLARVVPDLVIDVDDDVLLDISRLSVTSWSPREARRPRRRGWRIDDRAVDSVVVAASVEQLATLIGLVVVAAGASAMLVADLLAAGARGPLSVRLLLLASAVGLALTARAYRRRRDRTLLRLAALGPTLAVAVPALGGLGGRGVLVVTALAVVVALAMVPVALALGRGYRSLWASRLADLAELLALLAVLPLALWAAGLVDRAMALLA